MPSADLNARLTLTDNLTGGLRRSQSGVAAFARNAARSLFSVRGAFAAAAGAVGVGLLIKRTTEAVDSIGKLSDRIGISTEFISRFRFAAGQSGASLDVVDKSLERLSKRFGEYAQDGGGEAAKGIEALSNVLGEDLGERIRRGEDLEDLLTRISRGLRAIGNQGQRVAIVSQLFGREGASLVNLLQQRPQAIEGLLGRAPNVITRQQADSAAAFNDALDELSQTFSAFSTEIVLNFVPALTEALRIATGILRELRREEERRDNLGVGAGGRTVEPVGPQIPGGPTGFEGLQEFGFVGPQLPLGFRRTDQRAAQPSFPSAARRRGLTDVSGSGLLPGLPGTGPGEGISRVRDLNDELAQSNDLIEGLRAGVSELGFAFNTFNIAREGVQDLAFALRDGIGDNLISIIDGTKTVREAFADMAKSILQDLTRIIIKAIITRVVLAAIGGGAGGGGGAVGGLSGTLVQAIGGQQQTGTGFVTNGGLGPAPGSGAHGLFIRPGQMRHVIAHGGRFGEVILPLGPRFSAGSLGGGGGGLTQIINISAIDVEDFDRKWLGSAGRNARDVSTVVTQGVRSSAVLRRSMRSA